MAQAGPPAGIVVLRHGRREDSMNPEWQQQARWPWDTPLCATETEIAEAVARMQGNGLTRFDVVYTSPFLRCLETAERILGALGCGDVPVLIHRGLSEVHNPGLLFKAHGRPTMAQRARLWLWRSTYPRHSRPVRERFGVKARLVRESAWPPLPESEFAAAQRYSQVIMQLAAKHAGQQVLVVSHGKAVQVAHEAMGCSGRVLQVSFAGFIACRAKPDRKSRDGGDSSRKGRDGKDASHKGPDGGRRSADGSQAPAVTRIWSGGRSGGGGVTWGSLELDPGMPYFMVDVIQGSSPDMM
ncbi:hypothetical protein HYH03_000983 [Edaphochlamys debaryana]|uniref:Uncharacterized protein n=1 Tax=Edaphochlamys debaryana TaxID=47281 RepID=A0A835YEE0_9CHLO|nr:hypothetical protein HYH03_000983 [Edaphochlamys debaryana]|eukprot:KAG2501168.1 hypothetical protein HYH03_000983 [Edaphochlamys debaryana]